MQDSNDLKELKELILTLQQENKHLQEMVAYLTKKLYGRSSETSKALDIQMSLFDEAETEADPKAKEPTLEEVDAYRRKKWNGQRKEKLENLKHHKVLVKTLPEDQTCLECGTEMKYIGEEFVRTEVEFIPAQLKVIDYYREVYECRKCKKEGKNHIERSPMPDPVIPHSFASASSVAHIMYQKYGNALPLYRQETDWKNLGLNLGRATMSNWIIFAAENWLKPIFDLMHEKLLQEKYLHADETTIQVMNEKGRKNTTKSYMWVYANYAGTKTPIRLFEYCPTRNGDNAIAFLNGFIGYLISDAYQGYNKVKDVKRCYCWCHLRRYFVEALPKDTKDAKATAPAIAIEYCAELFDIEKEIADKEASEKQRIRQEKAKPILDDFFSWVEQNQNKYLPKSKLGQAFSYAMNQKEGLMRYIEDGNIAISNNLAENAIRPFTIGRKNWLFSGSPKGAEASAIVYSMIETAKANNLDPFKYLKYIFKNMPGTSFQEYPEILEELLPWDETVQAKCSKTL